MRFDVWLDKNKNRSVGINFIFKEYQQTGYNPLFKYRYCLLFIRSHRQSQEAFIKGNIRQVMEFENWLFTLLNAYGRAGNLSRDLVDTFSALKEKLTYCKKYCRHFETAQRAYLNNSYRKIEKMDLPTNLGSPIEGVQRVSVHLMNHPSFRWFPDFMSVDMLPDQSRFVDCGSPKDQLMKARSSSPFW